MIKVHFPLNEAGWGPGQPDGTPDQLPRPQQEASGKAQGEGCSSCSVDRLCLCPELSAAWPTHDYRSRGATFHGPSGLPEVESLQLTLQARAHNNLEFPTFGQVPHRWCLLVQPCGGSCGSRLHRTGSPPPSRGHVQRMRWAG